MIIESNKNEWGKHSNETNQAVNLTDESRWNSVYCM